MLFAEPFEPFLPFTTMVNCHCFWDFVQENFKGDLISVLLDILSHRVKLFGALNNLGLGGSSQINDSGSPFSSSVWILLSILICAVRHIGLCILNAFSLFHSHFI